MTDPTNRPNQQHLWHLAERYLEQLYLPAEISEDRLPLSPRKTHETLPEWLQRLRNRKLVPQTEFIRLAAAAGGTTIPLPDPGTTLNSRDGRFRLTLSATADQQIEVTLQAMGFSSFDFANRNMGLVIPDQPDRLIGEVLLNEQGRGTGYIVDNELHRRALLKPTIVWIQEEEA